VKSETARIRDASPSQPPHWREEGPVKVERRSCRSVVEERLKACVAHGLHTGKARCRSYGKARSGSGNLG